MDISSLLTKRNISLATTALSFPPAIYVMYKNSSSGSLSAAEMKDSQVSEPNPVQEPQKANTENDTPPKKPSSKPNQKNSGIPAKYSKYAHLIPRERAGTGSHKTYNAEELKKWEDATHEGTVYNDWKKIESHKKLGYQTVKTGGRFFNPVISEEKYVNSLRPYIKDEFTNSKTPPLIGEDKAKPIIETLMDYTIFLQEDATAWILDYEIQDNPANDYYPTKWFLVTAAHTVEKLCFPNNQYQQHIHLKQYMKSCPGNSLQLYKYPGSDYVYVDQAIYPSSYSTFTPKELEKEYVNDVKFVYVPKNSFGAMFVEDKKDKSWDDQGYMMDVVFIELDFKDKATAKKMTNDFYTKYHNQSGKKRINFFADEPTPDNGYDKNYFIVGRSSGSTYNNTFFSNYSSRDKKAGRLLKKGVHAAKHKMWNRKENLEFGMRFELDSRLPPKSIGALAVDSDMNALGVLIDIGETLQHLPLRHSGTRSDEFENMFLTPKYDLILGAEGQIGSYREQLEKYLPDVKTYLKNEWTTKDNLKSQWQHLTTRTQ